MSSVLKVTDPRKRSRLAVTSVPSDINSVFTVSFNIAAGFFAELIIYTTPDDTALGLWNFLRSIRIDVNDYDHRFRNGDSLTTAQRKLRIISECVDYDDSSDLKNIRAYKIILENYDVSAHDYYVRFKAYTGAASAGGAGSQ
jgi:hypothetical protein